MLCKRAPADVAGEGPLPAVRLQVNLQVTGRLEALAAEPAAVRPVHRVLLLVRAQVGDRVEPLAAEHARARNSRRVHLEVLAKRIHAGHLGAARHARQRVLTRVRVLLMNLQGALLDETFATGVAAEGTLAGVRPLMVFQRVRLVEAFATSFTPERLFPRVYAQVALQVALYRKAFVAVLAAVRPLFCVDHLVHFQTVCSLKALPTLFTVEQPHLGMETLVVPQEPLQGETFPTDVTGMWSLTCIWEHQYCKKNKECIV